MVNVLLMVGLGWQNWLRLFLWLLVGQLLYFGYGRQHAHLSFERAAAVNQEKEAPRA